MRETIREIGEMDKKGLNDTEQYKQMVSQLAMEQEKQYRITNTKKWKQIQEANITKDHRTFWKTFKTTTIRCTHPFPDNIQLKDKTFTKDKGRILEDAITTLEQITTQKDNEAKEYLTPKEEKHRDNKGIKYKKIANFLQKEHNKNPTTKNRTNRTNQSAETSKRP